MANVIERGTMLPHVVVEEMFNLVKGHSSLAKLSPERPFAFNGNEWFTFTLDKEVDIVAESGPKSNGGGTVESVTSRPVKFEYGMRVSDEFLYGSEEYRLNILRNFAEGAARKGARGLDIAAIHGVNPRTGEPAETIGTNCIDKKAATKIAFDATAPDTNLDTAVAAVQALDGAVTGIAMAPAFSSALAGLKVNGVPQYPEFRFGANPGNFYGMGVDVNSTIAFNGSEDKAIVGDFVNAFKWGYAKNIPLEVIQYGNPDNDTELGDLKGHNQVYLRAEFYIGWGILDGNSFAVIGAGEIDVNGIITGDTWERVDDTPKREVQKTVATPVIAEPEKKG